MSVREFQPRPTFPKTRREKKKTENIFNKFVNKEKNAIGNEFIRNMNELKGRVGHTHLEDKEVADFDKHANVSQVFFILLHCACLVVHFELGCSCACDTAGIEKKNRKC
jgi:hypothetical protein